MTLTGVFYLSTSLPVNTCFYANKLFKKSVACISNRFQLTKLRELDLFYNKLKSIPDEISQLDSLSNLYLAFNELSYLPETIGDLSISQMFIHHNKLTSLPSSVSKLKNLKTIFVFFLEAVTLNCFYLMKKMYWNQESRSSVGLPGKSFKTSCCCPEGRSLWRLSH